LHQPGDDWDTACLRFLSSWVWRAIVELGERMETRQDYAIENLENLETPDNYYYRDFVLQVIDDDAKMSSFLSFLNQKGGEGKKQTSGQQRVVEWLQEALDPPPGRVWPREATGRNVNLQKDLLQIARLEGDKIDWNRLREIIKKQLQVRRFSPLLLFHERLVSLSIENSLKIAAHENEILRWAFETCLDRPEPKATRSWDAPFAGLFADALKSVVGDDWLSAAFDAAVNRRIFVHMQKAFRAMVRGGGFEIDSTTNPLATELHDGDPGPPFGDSTYVGFSLSHGTTRATHALRFSLPLSLSLSRARAPQEQVRQFGEGEDWEFAARGERAPGQEGEGAGGAGRCRSG